LNVDVKQQWADLLGKFEALNERERMMIFAAVLTVFYGVYTYLIEPVLKEQSKLRAAIAQDTTSANNFDLQLKTLVSKHGEVKLTPEENKINALKAHLVTLEEEVYNVKNMLIKPEKMPDLLSDILSRNKDLTLVSLKTLPIKRLFDKGIKDLAHDHELPIFKHGVELTVEGRYLDLLSYVASVEKLPWQLSWDNAELVVDKKPTSPYPLTQLTMSISTLSLEKNWLSI
jgi:MSHA biogenesis protein MshJ